MKITFINTPKNQFYLALTLTIVATNLLSIYNDFYPLPIYLLIINSILYFSISLIYLSFLLYWHRNHPPRTRIEKYLDYSILILCISIIIYYLIFFH
jgi:hypothetical protein